MSKLSVLFMGTPDFAVPSLKVLIDKYGKTSNTNVYCIGDCSGYVRGLTTAFSHGILCAEDILNNIDIK